jgi:hypothetical protein
MQRVMHVFLHRKFHLIALAGGYVDNIHDYPFPGDRLFKIDVFMENRPCRTLPKIIRESKLAWKIFVQEIINDFFVHETCVISGQSHNLRRLLRLRCRS